MAMSTRSRGWVFLVLGVALVATMAYLRDPPWLISVSSGMRGWEMDATGVRVRWTGGHASFFVPADARSIELPLRTTFDRPSDWPITVSVAIDDRPPARLVLADPAWHRSVLIMPAPGSRKVRRIDIRTDRTRDDNRGAALGDVVIRR
jgi:hypothetical protein